jgi:hypothetical protein
MKNYRSDFKNFNGGEVESITYEELYAYALSEGIEKPGSILEKSQYPETVKYEFTEEVIAYTSLDPESTRRQLYYGTFEYDAKGNLKDSYFDEIVSFVFYSDGSGNFEKSKPPKPLSPDKTNNYLSWTSSISEVVANEKWMHVNFNFKYNIESGDITEIYFDDYSNSDSALDELSSGSLAKYYPEGWHKKPFDKNALSTQPAEIEQEPITSPDSQTTEIEQELITSPDSQTTEIEQELITAPDSYKKKLADKITNFNPSTDTLEIDTDSFGIDSSFTFAAGKNKKAVKKLAKQDFDLLYDQKKGGLYFNENGSDKGFGDGGIIAILKRAPDLTSDNLEFI